MSQNHNELIIGDEAALWTFGSEAQAALGLATKAMAEASNPEHAENSLRLLTEVSEKLEKATTSRRIRNVFHKDRTPENRSALMKQIRDMSVSMQLRQAQLARDTAILEQAEKKLKECCEQLELCFDEGEKRIQGQMSAPQIGALSDDSETRLWMERFENRLNELQLTKTIAIQSLAQIRILKAGKQDLMQKLQSLVNNVIPLWRSCAALEWGMKEYQTELSAQSKALRTAQREIKNSAYAVTKSASESVEQALETEERQRDLLDSSKTLLAALHAVIEEEQSVSSQLLKTE